MLSRIKQTDLSLSKYYKLHNVIYFDNDGIGKFVQWADDNGFDSDGIEEEFTMEYTESSLLDMDEQFPPKNVKPKQIIDILRKCWTDPNAYEPIQYKQLPEALNTGIVQNEQEIEHQYDFKRSEIIICGYARIEYNILIPEAISKIIINFYHHKFGILSFSTTILDERYADKISYKLSHNNRRVTNCERARNMFVSELGINHGYKKGIHVFRYNLFMENTAIAPNANGMFWGIQAYGANIEENICQSKNSKYIFGWESTGEHNVKKCITHNNENLEKHCDLSLHKLLNCKLITFDLKLDCDQNRLTYIDVSLDEIIFANTNFCSKANIYIPTEFTDKYNGWIPHVYVFAPGQSVVIVEIDPCLFGINCHQVNHQVMKIFETET